MLRCSNFELQGVTMAFHADAPVARKLSKGKRSNRRQSLALRAALIGVCAMFAAAGALAGELNAVVTPLAPSVSWSVGDSNPVASYTVTLTNTGSSNSIDNGRFVATTSVLGSQAGAQAVFKSVIGAATCGVSQGGTRVDCSVDGSLAPGASSSFTLNYYSPTSGTSILLAWNAVFDSGTPPGGSNGDNGETAIGLTEIQNNEVASAVPAKEDVAIYTGYLALPSSSDPFTTAIMVPKANSRSSTATVTESDISGELNCTNLRNFKRCFSSKIDIPNVVLPWSPTDYLAFTLSIDKSNFRGGAKIGKTLILYTDPVNGISNETVQFCQSGTDGKPVPDTECKMPCIAKANDYSSKKSPLGGWYGFQWEILACKNGFFDIF
jgi:hypothetical protein